jgi:hypothetical protein
MYRFFESEHSIVPDRPAATIAGTILQANIDALVRMDEDKKTNEINFYAGMEMQPIPLTMLVPSNVISAAGATVAPNDELTAPHLQVNTIAKDLNLQDAPTKTLIDVMNKMLGDEPTKSEWKYAQNVPEVGNNRLNIDAAFSSVGADATQEYAERLAETGTAICIRLSDTFAATTTTITPESAKPRETTTANLLSDIDALFSLMDINDKTVKSDKVTSVVTQGRVIVQQFVQFHNNNNK